MKSGSLIAGVIALLALTAMSLPAVAQEPPVEVNCDEVEDPKKHGRSGKSYWGIATKSEPYDMEVMRKAETQFAMGLCGLPDKWEWNMFMGMVHCEFGRYEMAGPFFERALDNAEKDKHTKQIRENREHYWVKLYNDGLTMFNEGNYVLAEESAAAAVKLDPTDCRGYTLYGPALVQNNKFDQAVELLEAGVEVCPNSEPIADNLFAAYHNRGNEFYNNAGSAEDKGAEFAKAAAYYEKADALDAEHMDNLYQWGVSLLQVVQAGDTTQVEPCREVFTRFIDLAQSPEDKTLALYNLTLLLIDSGAWAGAEETAAELMKISPFDPDGYALHSRVLMNTERAGDVEPYIIFTNCLRQEEVADAGSWCAEASSRYGSGSDFAKFVNSSAKVERVWVKIDSSENEMVTVYDASKGALTAFYAGERKGEVSVNTQG